MNYISVILSILGLVALAGTATAYFKRSAGMGTIELLRTNIEAYKDSEKLKDQRIAYLEGQLVIKDETIKRLVKE